jgi:predicted PurR-regulated permease PerM
MDSKRPLDDGTTPAFARITVPYMDARSWRKVLLRVGIAALVLYVAWTVRSIYLPLGLAFLIALVLDPVVDRLEARGWSRTWGAILIYSAFIVLVTVVTILSIPVISEQTTQLQVAVNETFPDRSNARAIKESLLGLGLVESVARPAAHAIYTLENSGSQSSARMLDYLMQFGQNLVWIAIIPIVAFYALRDFHLILGKAMLLVPSGKRDLVQTAVSETTTVFAKYLRAMALVSGLNGLATWLLLMALGVDSAFLLGIVAGVLYSVPYIGAILTLILTAGISYIEGGPNMMLWATGTSWILHQVIFDQILAPKMLGGHVGLHPILSIVALLIGHLLLGIIGMILAVPVAACIQIGILALVPKLKQDIPLNGDSGDTAESLAEETAEEHRVADATQSLHDSVSKAVDKIEIEVEKEEALSAAQAKPS